MQIKSSLKLEGHLKLSKVFPDGRIEVVYDEDNIITLFGKSQVLSYLYTNPGITTDPIVSFRVGTGGTVDPSGLFPKLEDPTQTNLNTPLLSVTVAYTVKASVPSVTFLADLDLATGNGSLITEAGLVTNAGFLWNVKNFPGIPKTSEFNLHCEWTVKAA